MHCPALTQLIRLFYRNGFGLSFEEKPPIYIQTNFKNFIQANYYFYIITNLKLYSISLIIITLDFITEFSIYLYIMVLNFQFFMTKSACIEKGLTSFGSHYIRTKIKLKKKPNVRLSQSIN
jgi:hypothetical protein